MTQPQITGVGANQELAVTWPGPRERFGAIPPNNWFVLAAFLEPAKFAERLLASIHKAAPPADRDQQIKQLEQEIEKLERMEESLIIATGASRVSARRPEIVLGCRIVTTTRGARAA